MTLAAATARVMRWSALGPAAAVALAVVTWAALTDTDPLWPLRAAALLLVAGAAYGLDDPAGDVTAAVPRSLPVRRGVRIALLLGAVLGFWAVLLALLVLAGGPVPAAAAAVTLELLALLFVGLAVAARWGGMAGGPAAVALVLVTARLSERWSLLAGVPGSPHWQAAHVRWALVLLASAAALAWLSRDPAQTFRRTVTTRPSTVASSPGIGA